MTTLALITAADARANVAPCDCCDAEVAGTEIGEGLYLCQIHHAQGCPHDPHP